MSPRQAKGEAVQRELLPGQSPELLRELHLLGRDGALHADSLRKLKQVNHLVQLLEPALLDVRERHPEGVLVDAGAGNAYLAFVLYELFLRDPGAREILYCIEPREDLRRRAEERSRKLGFDRMRFVQAELARAELPERVHLLMALHACDTATDDAIAVGLRREPVPSAYRVFFRHIGIDPDIERTPIEAAVLERMLRGGFPTGGLLEDVLLIALLDTGVPVWALDTATLDGPLGVRTSGEGETHAAYCLRGLLPSDR